VQTKLRTLLTHSLKATGFKPVPLNIKSWFQNVPFKLNPRHYAEVEQSITATGVGRLHVNSP
jgi:hypothetical protein